MTPIEFIFLVFMIGLILIIRLFINSTKMTIYMITEKDKELHKELYKLIKADNLQEYIVNENTPEEVEEEKPRFKEMHELTPEELNNLELNPEDIYKWVVYGQDKHTNKVENII